MERKDSWTWDEKKQQLLIANYDKMYLDDLAIKLNVPYHVCGNKIRQLGLKKTPGKLTQNKRQRSINEIMDITINPFRCTKPKMSNELKCVLYKLKTTRKKDVRKTANKAPMSIVWP